MNDLQSYVGQVKDAVDSVPVIVWLCTDFRDWLFSLENVVLVWYVSLGLLVVVLGSLCVIRNWLQHKWLTRVFLLVAIGLFFWVLALCYALDTDEWVEMDPMPFRFEWYLLVLVSAVFVIGMVVAFYRLLPSATKSNG